MVRWQNNGSDDKLPVMQEASREKLFDKSRFCLRGFNSSDPENILGAPSFELVRYLFDKPIAVLMYFCFWMLPLQVLRNFGRDG